MATEPTPERPARAPRRWLYVVGGVAIALVAALVIVLVTDDGSDSAPAAEDTTTSTPAPETSTTAGAAPTTAPPVTPTTVPLPPLQNDPQSYAAYLFAAWQNGNQQAAAEVASPDAVQQLFAQPYQAGWTFGTCDPATGSVYCTWTSPGGTRLTMTVRNLTGGLPIQVLEVQRQAA